MKPLHIYMLLGFDILRSILPVSHNSKIIHLHSLNSTSLDKYIRINRWHIYTDSNFFLRLTDSTLSEEFSIFDLATRKRPKSRPTINLQWTTDEEDMRTMKAYRMSTRRKHMRHGRAGLRVKYSNSLCIAITERIYLNKLETDQPWLRMTEVKLIQDSEHRYQPWGYSLSWDGDCNSYRGVWWVPPYWALRPWVL